MISYSELALKTYGKSCEYNNCGWSEATCDVHHINYQEQHEFEKILRYLIKLSDMESFKTTLLLAKEKGFNNFNSVNLQLAKDDRANNLCVLCPNHHRYVHYKDLGLEILNYLPPRL